MITNLIATVLISVVTNWTDVYEQRQVSDPAPKGCEFDLVYRYHYENTDKYLGKDGMVVRVTEIKFDYEGKPQVHRIEEPLEKIIMRCRDKEPERVWDEPIKEKMYPNEQIIYFPNGNSLKLSNINVRTK